MGETAKASNDGCKLQATSSCLALSRGQLAILATSITAAPERLMIHLYLAILSVLPLRNAFILNDQFQHVFSVFVYVGKCCFLCACKYYCPSLMAT